MAKGGARPGAGRPKGSYSPKHYIELKARDRLMTKVYKNLEKLLDVKMQAALGTYYYEKVMNEGTGQPEIRKVFKGRPDQKAATELLEFTIGKARQSTDLSLDGQLDVPGVDKLGELIKAILEGKGKRAVVKKAVATPAAQEPTKEMKKEEKLAEVNKPIVEPFNATPLPVNPQSILSGNK